MKVVLSCKKRLKKLRILVIYENDLITATFSIKFKVIHRAPPFINTPEMPDVCLSFVLLFTIFIIVVTQKLVLQQSKNVTAKCMETLSPSLSIQYILGMYIARCTSCLQVLNVLYVQCTLVHSYIFAVLNRRHRSEH